MRKQILILSFSGRKNGNCEQISEFIASKLPGESKIFRFSENPIRACGDCRCQCFDDNLMCPHINDPEYGLLEQILISDQVYFVVPNHCDYPGAYFFIFNERSQVYFQGYPNRLLAYEAIPKKFIVVSNTESENFFRAFDYHCAGTPEIHFISPKKYGLNSIAANIMTSDAAKRDLMEILAPEVI